MLATNEVGDGVLSAVKSIKSATAPRVVQARWMLEPCVRALAMGTSYHGLSYGTQKCVMFNESSFVFRCANHVYIYVWIYNIY